MNDAHWWAPTGTPPPRDMDRDGVPVSMDGDGVTRWELISADPGFLIPPKPLMRLNDLEDNEE